MTQVSVDEVEARRDQLRTRAAELRDEIARLTNESREVDAQLGNAEVALAFIREVADPATATVVNSGQETSVQPLASPGMEDADDFILKIVAIRTPTGRVKSTELVTSIVREAPEPISRADIHRYARMVVGDPIPWENPSTAINNSIARAVENKFIHLVGGDHFAIGAGN